MMSIHRMFSPAGVLAGFLACQLPAAEFRSAWQDQADRVWAGPEYWANPMEDWRVQGGRLVCLSGGADRNVSLLTWQLTGRGPATVRFSVKRLDPDFRGWFGLRFGAKGLIDEYRHNAIFGQGLEAGIWQNGRLFLGHQTNQCAWTGEGVFELALQPAGEQCQAAFTLFDNAGKSLGQVRASFPLAEVRGNLALVSSGSGPRQRGAAGRGQPVASFVDWRVSGDLQGGPAQNWGPILWTQYTLSRGVLKLSAQFPPLGDRDAKTAVLQVKNGAQWADAATAEIDGQARVALFRLPRWEAARDTACRVAYRWNGQDYYHEGLIRRDPVDKAEIAVAGFTGNKDFAFPNREVAAKVAALNPDLLFFSGDQIYEGVGGYGIIRQPEDLATLNYLRQWYLFGWAFRDLLKDRPSVILPDDHDVFQGNLWGNGGRPAQKQEQGGYVMPPGWVNMVQRTQAGHLPDAYDPTPIEQGITVYYGDLRVGRVSFAILEDRKFKSGPAQFPVGGDTTKAVLLGERQLKFVRDWAQDWSGCDLKATLSQTVFAQCHTHGGREDRPIKTDRDANAWPPEGRNQALREIRKAFAFMYAGDNHLPTVAHHGIETWRDAGVSFTVPSIAAGFPRAWWPEQPGLNRKPGAPEYTGDFRDAWGHPLTMMAAANPKKFTNAGGKPPGDLQLLDDKSSGFGLVRFHTDTRKITIECYRILADLQRPETAQFPGWPITIDQLDNYGRKPVAWLPEVQAPAGVDKPVVQVVDERNGEVLYTLRAKSARFRPWVFAEGSYTVKIGEPPDRVQILTAQKARP